MKKASLGIPSPCLRILHSRCLWEWTFALFVLSSHRVNNIDHWKFELWENSVKVEKSLKGTLHLIPSPSLLVVVNKLLNTKSLLSMPINVLPLRLKQTFPPIFEFSLKLKMMGLNPGYLLNSFLLFYFSTLTLYFLK